MNDSQQGLSNAEYMRFRGTYTPPHPRMIFVLESPPVSGKYFYNPEGRTAEPLFSAMMKDVLEFSPPTKHEGLSEFAARGYLLIDATYAPVNIPGPAHLQDKSAAAQILKDLPLLVADLRRYAQPDTRLLLVKASVCRLLSAHLTQQEFNVLNGDLVIPFPTNGQQPKFRKMVRHAAHGNIALWRLWFSLTAPEIFIFPSDQMSLDTSPHLAVINWRIELASKLSRGDRNVLLERLERPGRQYFHSLDIPAT